MIPPIELKVFGTHDNSTEELAGYSVEINCPVQKKQGEGDSELIPKPNCVDPSHLFMPLLGTLRLRV